MKRLVVPVLIGVALTAAGCGQNLGTPQAPADRVEYFTATQAATETPHGKIELDTVEQTPVGVRYRTTDGSTHEVDMTPQPDGSFRLSNHRRLE